MLELMAKAAGFTVAVEEFLVLVDELFVLVEAAWTVLLEEDELGEVLGLIVEVLWIDPVSALIPAGQKTIKTAMNKPRPLKCLTNSHSPLV